MNKELSIIKLFIKDKAIFNKYKQFISNIELAIEIKNIFNTINSYYNNYSEHEYIAIQELETYFDYEYPQTKNKEVYTQLFKRISDLEISDSLAVDIVRQLLEKDFALKIINDLVPVAQGNENGKVLSIKKQIDDFEEYLRRDVDENPFVTDDFDDIFDELDSSNGIKWRLNCLNNDVGSLNGGSLGHIFARVDSGKTTFLVSEITNFATQLQDNECILWFNNEEKGKKVKSRIISGLLNASKQTIEANRDKAAIAFKEKGGDKIKLVDQAYITIEMIEKMVKEHQPKIIVIDQGDKINFYGGGSMIEVERLKQLYRKFREVAKKYNCDIITVGQASAEAHGKKWLEMIHMDYSKTGKPGELDYAIGIGKSSEEEEEDIRYIHLCKNKMHNGVHGRHTTLIDTQKARYKDI